LHQLEVPEIVESLTELLDEYVLVLRVFEVGLAQEGMGLDPLCVLHLAQLFGGDPVEKDLEKLLLPDDSETPVLGDVTLLNGLMDLVVLKECVHDLVGLHVLDALLGDFVHRGGVFMAHTVEAHSSVEASDEGSTWFFFNLEGLESFHVGSAHTLGQLVELFAVLLVNIVSFGVVTDFIIS
jgi:hypothetical protein